MPLMEPRIFACCDKCMDDSDDMGLTALAQSGSYDDRNIPSALKRMGWKVDGDKTFCPDCLERAENESTAIARAEGRAS